MPMTTPSSTSQSVFSEPRGRTRSSFGPEIDALQRALHEMAAASKSLINAFYGEAPRFSYFTGCSSCS